MDGSLTRQVTEGVSDDESINEDFFLTQQEEEEFLKTQSQSLLDDEEVTYCVKSPVRQHQQATLTQGGFTAERFSSRNKLKIPRKSAKKRKQDELRDQTTLTQHVLFSDKHNQSTEKLEDSENCVFVGSNMYRVQDAFELYDKSICVIDSFESFSQHGKIAIGFLYTPFLKTFIEKISGDKKFQTYVSEAKIDPNMYVRSQKQMKVPHWKFGRRVENFVPPSCPIIYSNDSTKVMHRFSMHGFTVSYRHSQYVDELQFLLSKYRSKISDSDFQKFQALLVELRNEVSEYENMVVSEILTKELHESAQSIVKLQSLLKIKKSKRQRNLNENHHTPIPTSFIHSFETVLKQVEDHIFDCACAHIANVGSKHRTQSIASCNDGKIALLDVFSGIGGMSQGFIDSGYFDVKWAVDESYSVASTFQLNHRDTCFFEEDVDTWYKKVKEAITNGNSDNRSPYKQVLNAHHIHFSPPCQKFSPINQGGKNDEKNARLTLFSIDIIRLFSQHGKMKSISMENVTGIFREQHRDYLKTFVLSLVGMNMNVRVDVLDSSRYGDPQKRNRVFVTACKPNLALNEFPKESHDYDNPVTVSDVLEDLSQVDPTEGNGFVELPGGTFTKNHGRHNKDMKDVERLVTNKPAHTIRRKANVGHYRHDRTLTAREMARLQSFPDSFQLCGSHTDQINGIGNAVPVKVATALARSIRSMYPSSPV